MLSKTLKFTLSAVLLANFSVISAFAQQIPAAAKPTDEREFRNLILEQLAVEGAKELPPVSEGLYYKNISSVLNSFTSKADPENMKRFSEFLFKLRSSVPRPQSVYNPNDASRTENLEFANKLGKSFAASLKDAYLAKQSGNEAAQAEYTAQSLALLSYAHAWVGKNTGIKSMQIGSVQLALSSALIASSLAALTHMGGATVVWHTAMRALVPAVIWFTAQGIMKKDTYVPKIFRVRSIRSEGRDQLEIFWHSAYASLVRAGILQPLDGEDMIKVLTEKRDPKSLADILVAQMNKDRSQKILELLNSNILNKPAVFDRLNSGVPLKCEVMESL